MEKNITINHKDKDGNGFKIIEVNLSNPAENIYAVCTPITKQ